ncbi:hypothetical protein EDEG_02450 [Edhazardia aedis USNM 41457]|uniref:Uncharacterized protein n=1 Tax=Edhazardia aedis (strain USNM 41457) TaxID=1003232 RepID=J9DPD0_EDHAE|nr:hypothetical protein EDEG_02450 [Edhazardia aedis USNM 41457]|eukprot:EJW03197.1 hypothetical protein EDEG_02450 [Edhazardia aedis USNM 41457]
MKKTENLSNENKKIKKVVIIIFITSLICGGSIIIIIILCKRHKIEQKGNLTILDSTESGVDDSIESDQEENGGNKGKSKGKGKGVLKQNEYGTLDLTRNQTSSKNMMHNTANPSQDDFFEQNEIDKRDAKFIFRCGRMIKRERGLFRNKITTTGPIEIATF